MGWIHNKKGITTLKIYKRSENVFDKETKKPLQNEQGRGIL